MHRLFTIFAVASLLSCLAVVVLWPLSYRDGGSTFPASPAAASTYVRSFRGQIRLRVCDRASAEPFRASNGSMSVYRLLPEEQEVRADLPHLTGSWFDHGYARVIGGTTNGGRTTKEQVPFWSLTISHRQLLIITSVLPVCWLLLLALRSRLHLRRQHRILSGLCAACGYDLRASPHRCPECGHVAAILAT